MILNIAAAIIDNIRNDYMYWIYQIMNKFF